MSRRCPDSPLRYVLSGVIAVAFVICALPATGEAADASLADAASEPLTAEQEPEATFDIEQLGNLSLEELLSIKIPATSIATNTVEPFVAVSGTVYIITEDDIRAYGWRTLREALQSVPNLDLYWNYGTISGGQRGSVGGFSGTLLLIDGREVQNLENSSIDLTNNFPLHRVARIEVLQGPNATIYGANCKEGVINIVTKIADPKASPGELASVWTGNGGLRELDLSYRSFGDDVFFGASASVMTFAQDWPELIKFAADSDKYSRADAVTEATRQRAAQDFQQDETGVTFDLHGRYHALYAGLNYIDSSRSAGIAKVQTDYSKAHEGRSFVQGYLGASNEWSFVPNLKDNLSVMAELHYAVEEDSHLSTQTTSAADATLVSSQYATVYDAVRWRLKTQAVYLVKPGELGLQNQILLAYDLQRLDHLLSAGDLGDSSVAPGRPSPQWSQLLQEKPNFGTWLTHSLSLQDAIGFFDAKLKLTGGINWFRRSFIDDHFSPRASLVYNPSEELAFKMTYGKAFRPLNVAEYLARGDRPAQETEMLEFNYTHGFAIDRLHVLNILAGYRLAADRLAAETGEVTERVRRYNIYGVEDRLSIKLEHWSAHAAVRYVRPDTTRALGYDFVSQVPPVRGSLGVSVSPFKTLTSSLWFEGASRVLSLVNRPSGAGQEIYSIPAYLIVNGNVRLGEFQEDSVFGSVSFDVENIFNQRYYHPNLSNSSPIQYLQPPRSFYVNLALRV